MGVTKQTLSAGNGVDFPKQNDTVTMEYTGWLYDASKPDNKGSQFDSSVGKGNFDTVIGEGRVIKGWDEGIIGTTSAEGMSLGEKATLTISCDYGYGAMGFPGAIPPGADLVFDVQLIAINGKRG
ncbi:peptidyl-prolyl cis-trans isomerase [Venturia nashicola]|uniref:peptidylprolyl isomerase n=1 Tax=Venturia nashicola TaxID=86259 RepID=A0A4Z1P4L7_9PEZI|nr:peptidyl-prolyl cis-trans isomerase [Venturia nashicola]TLD36450.1 peptidyl-prolyl cis-trans isomerase [Venturia nashicola]